MIVKSAKFRTFGELIQARTPNLYHAVIFAHPIYIGYMVQNYRFLDNLKTGEGGEGRVIPPWILAAE